MFKLLHARHVIDLHVFYTWGEKVLENKYDPGFGKVITWDIPLLEGYEFSFPRNVSTSPGSHHFKGIDNPTLLEDLRAWKPDAILVYGWKFKSHLAAIRHFHGKVPIYFRGDSTLIDREPWHKSMIRNILLRGVYRRIDKVLYTGQANKAYFKAAGIKESNMLFAGHAVENQRFASTMENMAAGELVRDQHGISRDAMVFLFAGKFEPKKNPALLIQAFKQLNGNPHLLIAGNGEMENTLRELAGNSSHIHFLPFQNQSQMPGLYHAADVFVLPSSGPGETWGLSVNEAMAAGKAIIASDACGCAMDLVQDGINGYVFLRNNLASLEEKLHLLAMAPTLVKSMGQQSLQIISNFTLEQVASTLENDLLQITTG